MREIIIDTDTLIGYDYENHQFYVTNKDTTTTRTETVEAKKVLDIVAPNNDVTLDDLVSLATTMETLTALYYTWADDGSCIKTVQLNDYEKYPMTIDVEKGKLYIMNTTTIFDLTLNEGRRERLLQIQAFYRDTLGLTVSLHDLQVIYLALTSFYQPKCYNEITVKQSEDDENKYTMWYTNKIILSNYDGTSPATYTCTRNPNNEYNYSVIADITEINENYITLTNSVPSEIQAGSVINLSNTAYTMDISNFSSDGTYTVKSVETNTIYTTENLPAPFYYNPPKLEIVAYKSTILSATTGEDIITLSDFPTGFLVGDTIVVEGTEIPTAYQTLTIDGTYAIISIENRTLTTSETETVVETETDTLTQTATETTVNSIIYVNDVLTTNYENNTTGAYVYKPIETNTIRSIDGSTITVDGTVPPTLTAGTEVCINFVDLDGNSTKRKYATVASVDTDHVVLSSEEDTYKAGYGLLRKPIPFPNVLTEVETSKNTDVLPTGEFMVDEPEQAIQYLGLLDYLVNYDLLPSNEQLSEDSNNTGNFNKMNKQVETYYIIEMVGENPNKFNYMYTKGAYSRIYEGLSRIEEEN